MPTKINEATELAIPLKKLIVLVTFTGVSVWADTGITERIAFLEHNLQAVSVEVEENDEWIDNFSPPPELSDTVKRVRDLELKIKELEVLLHSGENNG